MDKTITTIEKNSNEEIRIEISEYNNHDLFSMRIWAKIDDKQVPTRKGITVNVKLLPELIKALTEAEQIAKHGGLLNE